MISPEDKLRELGIKLPATVQPLGAYLPCVQAGDLVFLSAVFPLRDGILLRSGRVGESVSLQEAQEEARQVVINALAMLKSHLGDLSKVSRCIKMNGYVASDPLFIDQPKVLNAASELLYEIFGEQGRHARSAIGAAVLPFGASVGMDFIFEITH